MDKYRVDFAYRLILRKNIPQIANNNIDLVNVVDAKKRKEIILRLPDIYNK